LGFAARGHHGLTFRVCGRVLARRTGGTRSRRDSSAAPADGRTSRRVAAVRLAPSRSLLPVLDDAPFVYS
jgi:hypothetical protein